eukprot:9239625-Pyramimonas_sp.AAC.1
MERRWFLLPQLHRLQRALLPRLPRRAGHLLRRPPALVQQAGAPWLLPLRAACERPPRREQRGS